MPINIGQIQILSEKRRTTGYPYNPTWTNYSFGDILVGREYIYIVHVNMNYVSQYTKNPDGTVGTLVRTDSWYNNDTTINQIHRNNSSVPSAFAMYIENEKDYVVGWSMDSSLLYVWEISGNIPINRVQYAAPTNSGTYSRGGWDAGRYIYFFNRNGNNLYRWDLMNKSTQPEIIVNVPNHMSLDSSWTGSGLLADPGVNEVYWGSGGNESDGFLGAFSMSTGGIVAANPRNPIKAADLTGIGVTTISSEAGNITLTALHPEIAYYFHSYTRTLVELNIVPSTPIVKTGSASSVGVSTISMTGSVSNLKSSVTNHGYCWSASNKNPTTSDLRNSLGSKTTEGSYSSNITGLSKETTYYIRGYIELADGRTLYDNPITISTNSGVPATNISPITDADISLNSVSVSGEVTSLGGSDPLDAHGFIYSISKQSGQNLLETDGGEAHQNWTQWSHYSSGYWGVSEQYDDPIYGKVNRLTKDGASSTYTYIYDYFPYSYQTGERLTFSCWMKVNKTISKGINFYINSSSGGQHNVASTHSKTVNFVANEWQYITWTSGEVNEEVNGTGGFGLSMGIGWEGCIVEVAHPVFESGVRIELGSKNAIGTISANITGLDPATGYRIVSYGVTKYGTSYGDSKIAETKISITDHGFYIGSIANAVINGTKVSLGSTSSIGSSFSNVLTSLSGGEIYFIRSYATTQVGTYYGKETSALTELAITNHGFVWGKTKNPTTVNSKTTLGSLSAPKTITSNSTSLDSASLYYIRPYASTSTETFYGEESFFETKILVLEHGFVWGENPNPTILDYKNNIGTRTTAGSYSNSITSLLDGTIYFVRAYTKTNTGVYYGENIPVLTKLAVSDLGFAYSTSNTNPTISNTKKSLGSANTPVSMSSTITNLTGTSLYYMRPYATTKYGTTYGQTIFEETKIEITDHGFVWNTTGSPTINSNKKSLGSRSATGSFSGTITGLTPSTLYYIRPYAQTATGVVYGNQITAQTADGKITISGMSISGLTDTTANGSSSIINLNGNEVKEHGHVISTSPTPSISNAATTLLGSRLTTGSFSSNFTSLARNTTYYIRGYATSNHDVTAYTEETSFTTQTGLATVLTRTVASKTSNSININGEITALNGENVIAHGHVWGLNSNPTLTNDEYTNLGSKTAIGTFVSTIPNLAPSQTYYIRAYATTAVGTTYGTDITVVTNTETQSTAPPAPTATGITSSSLTLISDTTVKGILFEEPFEGLKYGTYQTTVNQADGILSVTSTGGDPMIHMHNIGSWNPEYARYVELRYRVTSGTASNWQIFFTNDLYTSANGAQCINSGGLLSDGAWHTSRIDGWSHGNWKTNGNIRGFRLDWNTVSGVTMEIDYVRILSDPLIVCNGETKPSGSTWTGLSRFTAYNAYAYLPGGNEYTQSPNSSTVSIKTMAEMPVVRTGYIAEENENEVAIDATIVDGGGENRVSNHGVCWSTSPNPTISNSKVSLGTQIIGGTYRSYIPDIQDGNTYYIRAYVTNSAGTAYGSQVTYTASLSNIVARLKEGDLLIKGKVNERLPVITSGLSNHFPLDHTADGMKKSFIARAKRYPEDSYYPDAGLYDSNRNLIFHYGRAWHISVWDTYTNDWATGVNFYGAESSGGAHARYDTYDSSQRSQQQQAFIDTLTNLNERYYVIIAGSHAPEHYSAGMIEQIKRCGGTQEKLSWTGRSNYICVGQVGSGEGNAISEELDNISINGVYAEAKFDLLTSPITNINTTFVTDGVAIEEGTTNLAPNPTGEEGATPYDTSWDSSLHQKALKVDSWSQGYNAGIKDPQIGYHGQWVYEGKDGNVCMKFIDLNSQFSYTDGSGNMAHRWLGISSITIGSGTSLGWTTGDQITLSWDQKSDTIGKGGSPGIYHKSIASGGNTFGPSRNTIGCQKANEWERVSYTFTIDSDWDLSTNYNIIYMYGYQGPEGTLWIDNIQVEHKPFATSFVDGSRGNGNLTIPLTLESDFTLFYKFTPDIDWGDYYDVGYGKRMFNLYDKNTGKKIWLQDYHGSAVSTTSVPWIGFDEFVTSSSGHPWHWHSITVDMQAKKECWFALTKNGTIWKKYLFSANGLQTSQITHNEGTVGAFTPSKIEFVHEFSATIKDLSFWNRALTETEIEKVVSGNLSLDNKGNVFSQIKEKPLSLPTEGIYLPLTYNSSNEAKTIKPTAESNTVYENGAVWVGESYTNLFTHYIDGQFPVKSGKLYKTMFFDDDLVIYRHDFSGETWNYKGVDVAVTAGTTYHVNLDIYVSEDFNGTYSTMARVEQTGSMSFNYNMNKRGTWQRFEHTFTPSANGNTRLLMYPGPNNNTATKGYVLYRNFQMTAGSHKAPFMNGTRGISEIMYDKKIIDIAQPNWSIFGYYNKRVYKDNSYFLYKEGSYSLHLGNYSTNTFAPFWNGTGGAARPTSPQHEKITDEWKFFAMTRDAGAVNIYDGMNGIIYSGVDSRGAYFDSHTTTGWKITASTGFNGYLKNIGFLQRTLTEAEIKSIYNTQMSIKDSSLHIQNGIIEDGEF